MCPCNRYFRFSTITDSRSTDYSKDGALGEFEDSHAGRGGGKAEKTEISIELRGVTTGGHDDRPRLKKGGQRRGSVFVAAEWKGRGHITQKSGVIPR